MSILNANCDGHTVIRNQDSEDITRPYGARNRKVTPARVKSESKSTVVSQNPPRSAFPSVTRVSLPSSPTVPTENVAPVKVETTANLDQTKVGSVSIQPTNSEPINSQSAKTENPNSSPERVALHSLSTSILSVQIPYRNAAGLRDDVKQIEKGLSRSILINAVFVFVLCMVALLRRVLFCVSSKSIN